MSRGEEEKVVRENNKDYYPCGYDIESIKVVRNKLLDFQAALKGMNLGGKKVSDIFEFCYNQTYQKLGEVGTKHGYANFPPPYFKDIQSLDEITEAVRNLDRLITGNVKNLVFGSGAFFTRGYYDTNLYLPTEYAADRMQKVFGTVEGETIEKADFKTGGMNNFCFSAPNAFWLYGSGYSDEKKNGVSFVTTSMKFDVKKALKDLSNMNISDERLSREEFLIIMNCMSPYVDKGMARIIFGNPNQFYEINSDIYSTTYKSTIRSNGSAINAKSDSLIHLSTDSLDNVSLLKLENANYSCICNFSDYRDNPISINVIVEEAFMDEFMNDYKDRLTDFFAINLEYSKAKRRGNSQPKHTETMVAPTDVRVKRAILVPKIKR